MSLTLYTDLDPGECASRLSASGWAGQLKPRSWQATATDRDIFRRIIGDTFQLDSRSAAFPVTASSGGRFRAPQYFHGRLTPQGRGTRITGYYGASPRDKRDMIVWTALGLGVATVLAALENTYDWRGTGSTSWPAFIAIMTIVAVLVYGFIWGSNRPDRHLTDAREDYFAGFLAEALEARPITAREEDMPRRT